MIRKMFVTAFVVLAVFFTVQGICLAAKLDSPVQGWKEIMFQGRISHISPNGDHLFVSERKVVLVDARFNGRHYRTDLLDLSGRAISFKDIRKGGWAYIWGGLLKGGTVGARAIVLMPDQIDEKTLRNRLDFLKKGQPWDE